MAIAHDPGHACEPLHLLEDQLHATRYFHTGAVRDIAAEYVPILIQELDRCSGEIGSIRE